MREDPYKVPPLDRYSFDFFKAHGNSVCEKFQWMWVFLAKIYRKHWFHKKEKLTVIEMPPEIAAFFEAGSTAAKLPTKGSHFKWKYSYNDGIGHSDVFYLGLNGEDEVVRKVEVKVINFNLD